MAAVIAFNAAAIGTTSISTAQFVTGSGTLTVTGTDTTINTADGKIHQYRVSTSKKAVFKLYGDYRSLHSATGAASQVNLYYGTTSIAQFNGIVSVSYTAQPEISTVTIKGDTEF